MTTRHRRERESEYDSLKINPTLGSDTSNMATSGNKELDTLIAKWLEWNSTNPRSGNDVIKSLTDKQDWPGLSKIMMKRLKFGTAGIRGKVGPGYVDYN